MELVTVLLSLRIFYSKKGGCQVFRTAQKVEGASLFKILT